VAVEIARGKGRNAWADYAINERFSIRGRKRNGRENGLAAQFDPSRTTKSEWETSIAKRARDGEQSVEG
jgi:hypothetical protein